MVLSSIKHGQVFKSTPFIPTTETYTSTGDYKTNTSKLIPVEQAIQYMMLDELKAIHKLLEERK